MLSAPSRSSAIRNLDEARARALRLMSTLGEQELGRPLQDFAWQFEFDRARRRLGSCRWTRRGDERKLITLSRHYAVRMGLSYCDVRGLSVIDDVIRHEIAHAIDFERRGRSDHGTAWKAICLRVGADPTCLYEQDAALPAPPGKYVAQCIECGRETTYYRAPSRPRACRICCDAYADGRYDYRFRLDIHPRY